jgi:hypothetical protein
LLVNNAINPKYLAREKQGKFANSPRDDISFQLYPFKGLCWPSDFFACKRAKGKLQQVLRLRFPFRRRFFHPKKSRDFSPFNKENTQKISFVFRRDPFVKSDETFFHRHREKKVKKNKYRGSLNLWTIYIFMCDFFLVGDLFFVDDFIELV